jgi:hypothetical protein
VLFDATARDDQREYADRSLRETDRGSSRAASGGLPSKAAVAACGAPAAGAFLNSLPRKPELKLDEISFRDAVCHHFRLPNAHRIHGDMSRCPCGARPDVDPSVPSFAEHVLGCAQCSKGAQQVRWARRVDESAAEVRRDRL